MLNTAHPEGTLFAFLYLIFGPLISHLTFLVVHGMLQIDSTPTDILAIVTSYIAVPASYFFIVRPHFRTREKRATDDGFNKLVSALKSYPSNDANTHRDPYWEMVGEAMPHGRMKDTGLTAFLDLYHQTYGAGNISPDMFMENKENLAAILKRRFGVYSLDMNEDFKGHILNAGLLQELEVKLTPRKNETEIEFYSYLSGIAEKVGFTSTMVLVFFVVFLLPILMSYNFIVIPWQAYPLGTLLGLIFLILFGSQAIGAGVSFMARAWRKGKIRRGLPDLLDLLEEMSNNPGQKISSARSSEAKGPGLVGILRIISRVPALILGGMAAAMARVSFIRKMLFRALPVSALNTAGFSEMKFVKADHLPMEEAIDHVWNHRPAMARVREVYWSEVDNKNIKAKSSSARDAEESQKKWLEDLLRYWDKNEIFSFEVKQQKYAGKEAFRILLKSEGIPWPPTWR